jgi:Methyltransferase domain
MKSVFLPSTNVSSLGANFRKKRFDLFLKKTEFLPNPIKILDIGGLEDFWVNNGIANNDRYQITILNLKEPKISFSNFKGAIGDATNLLQYKEKEFDISFSNSVIDHLCTIDNQMKMAKEVCRVSKYYFVQCPYRYFPIEPHFVLPFAQYMPKKFLYFILTKTKLSRGNYWNEVQAKNYLKEIRLMSIKEMKGIFPGSKIYKERFAGFIKSLTAYNFV